MRAKNKKETGGTGKNWGSEKKKRAREKFSSVQENKESTNNLKAKENR